MTGRDPKPPGANPVVPIRSDATQASSPQAIPEFAERRLHPRYPFTAAAEVTELRSQARVAGRTADLGRGGCYVDTISPFPVATPVKIRLTFEKKCFESQGAVIYAHVGMGMGLAFTEIKPDQLPILQDWLAELSGEPRPPHPVTVQPEAEVQPEPTSDEEPPPREREIYVLNQLISLLVRKRLLTEKEGMDLLRSLFR